MFKRCLIIILSLCFIVPTLAQDDTPQAAINAALTAVEGQFGERATNYTFQLLGDSNDSSLGCPLIEGEELPFTLSAVRVDVIYPNNASYTVYTSISGQVTLLCDNKIDATVLANQLNAETVCNATPTQVLPAYEAPNINTEGVFATEVQAYRVYGVSSDSGWYQVASDTGLGWIDATSVILSGDCTNVPTNSVTNPVLQVVCFVEPQGGFTNVRSTPEGELVGRIYETEVHQISARNTAGTWFYIQPAGWVSNTVIFPVGDCNAIGVNDNAVGVGFATEEGVIDTDSAIILERFTCPADFAGYLIPRISIGEGTAQVTAGSVPNTLRSFPSVNDEEAPRLGVIQPQRVIDRVISGPACNQGFVWWLVEIDGVVGWTAESNQSSNDYYLDPTGDVAPLTSGDPSRDAIVTESGNPITELIYSADGSRLFALTTQQGFGDGQIGVVNVYDAITGDELATIEEPSGIADIDLATETNEIMVAALNGTITVYDVLTFEQTAQIIGAFSTASDPAHVEIAPDSSYMVIANCSIVSENCDAYSLNVVMNNGEFGASTPVPVRIIDLDISPNGLTLAVLTENGVTFHPSQSLALVSSWVNSDGYLLDSVVINEAGDSALFTGCNNIDCSEGRIGLLNIAEGNLLGVVPSHSEQATEIAYNADFTRFITLADASSEVIERNTATGEETQQFNSTEGIIVTIAYTSDGGAIASGTVDGRVVFLVLEN